MAQPAGMEFMPLRINSFRLDRANYIFIFKWTIVSYIISNRILKTINNTPNVIFPYPVVNILSHMFVKLVTLMNRAVDARSICVSCFTTQKSYIQEEKKALETKMAWKRLVS